MLYNVLYALHWCLGWFSLLYNALDALHWYSGWFSLPYNVYKVFCYDYESTAPAVLIRTILLLIVIGKDDDLYNE